MKYNKICSICRKEYICYHEKSNYCSRECYNKEHKLKNMICPVCKKEFKPTWKGQIHCNINCYAKSDKLKIEAKKSKLIEGNSENKWHEGFIKEDVSYAALHDWVRYHKEKTGKCEICGSEDSGYKERDFDLVNISGEYKRDINDFSWLCVKCHAKLDKIKRTKPYEIVGVECKTNGKLDKEEEKKCKWLLDNHVFSKILIAHKEKRKNKIEVIYEEWKSIQYY